MFYKQQEQKIIDALSVLAAALDNPQNPNREIYIKVALFTGMTLITDFLGYCTKSQIFQSHE